MHVSYVAEQLQHMSFCCLSQRLREAALPAVCVCVCVCVCGEAEGIKIEDPN